MPARNDDDAARIRNALDALPGPKEHAPAMQSVIDANGSEMTIDVCCRDVCSAAQAAIVKTARGAGYTAEAG